jgi:SAM-dependent methyltransferase
VGFLRSAYYLMGALIDIAATRPGKFREMFDREFASRRDPWNFGSPRELERLHRALDMLDTVRGGSRFRKALEIGCAEGVFTELLAPRCESLLAVDITPIALSRARERCRGQSNLRFAEWDFRSSASPGVFDLVVFMCVLEYFHWPSELRAARTKTLSLVSPGGYLLLSNTRGTPPSEEAWWGRFLISGGKWINSFFGQHPALRVVSSHTGETCVHTLFRKVL